MKARALEQGFDFGKAGIEMQLVEGRFSFRHQAVQAQFGDGFAYHIHRHAINAAFQLFDIDHDSSPLTPGVAPLNAKNQRQQDSNPDNCMRIQYPNSVD
ncbi:hypothetical protein D3C75_946740 [compost metagenome]